MQSRYPLPAFFNLAAGARVLGYKVKLLCGKDRHFASLPYACRL